MRNYIALIYKDPDSDYTVKFPDFPTCVTAGADLDEAAAMAEEALALHIEGMAEDGDSIPIPSSLEAVLADPANSGADAQIVVPAPKLKGRSLRLSITMDEHLLRAVDAQAGHGKRSAFIEEACRVLLEQSRGERRASMVSRFDDLALLAPDAPDPAPFRSARSDIAPSLIIPLASRASDPASLAEWERELWDVLVKLRGQYEGMTPGDSLALTRRKARKLRRNRRRSKKRSETPEVTP
jgi:predicted RNase H-like HicB family nuclease